MGVNSFPVDGVFPLHRVCNRALAAFLAEAVPAVITRLDRHPDGALVVEEQPAAAEFLDPINSLQ